MIDRLLAWWEHRQLVREVVRELERWPDEGLLAFLAELQADCGCGDVPAIDTERDRDVSSLFHGRAN